jgi:hypothetical protein
MCDACSHVRLYIKYTPPSTTNQPNPKERPLKTQLDSNKNPPLALDRQLNKSATTPTAPATLAVSRVAQRHVIQSIIVVVIAVIVWISLPAR